MEKLKLYPIKSDCTAARIVDGEAVVVLPMESEINTFNEVGTRIWELADGSASIMDIIDSILKEFEIDAKNAAQDTCEFLNELVEKKIIVLKEE